MRIANGRLSLFLAASLLAATVAARNPGPETGQSGPAQDLCSDGAGLVRSLSLTSADPGTSLRFAPSAGDSLTLSRVQTLAGPCIGLAKVFGPTGVLLFENDRAVTLHGMPKLSAGRNGEAYFQGYRALDADSAHPDLAGHSFVMATRTHREFAPDGKPVADFYAGVWRKGDAAVIASFSRPVGGNFTTPQPILASTAPIRSISYFPSPDTPSGSLGLIQEGNREIHLIAVRWSHPSPASGGV